MIIVEDNIFTFIKMKGGVNLDENNYKIPRYITVIVKVKDDEDTSEELESIEEYE